MSIFAVSSSAYEAPRPKLAPRQEAAGDRSTFADAMGEITHPDAPEATAVRPIPERPVQKVGVIDLGLAEAVSEPSASGKLEGMAATDEPQAVALQMVALAAALVPGENVDLAASGDQPQENLVPGATATMTASTKQAHVAVEAVPGPAPTVSTGNPTAKETGGDPALQIVAAAAAIGVENTVVADEVDAQEPEEKVVEGSGDATMGSADLTGSAALPETVPQAVPATAVTASAKQAHAAVEAVPGPTPMVSPGNPTGASVASVAMTATELAGDHPLQIAAATAAASGDNLEAGDADAQEPEEGVAEGSGDATTGSDGQTRSAALVGAVSPTDAQVRSKTAASDLSLPIASAATKAATKPDAPTPAGQTVPAMAASATYAPPKPDREVSEGEAAKTQQEAAKADSGLRADLQSGPSSYQTGKAPEQVQTPAQQHQPSPLPEPGKPIPPAAVPVEIGLRALQGLKEFQIRLDPAELGRVEVRLEIGDDKSVTARVVVDRVETLHLLQRDAKTLERAFEQAGLKPSDGGVDISLRDQGQQSRGDGSDGRPNRYGDRAGSAGKEADNVPLQPVMQRRLHMGALDLSV